MESWSQPSLVLTVTGSFVLLTISFVNLSILSISFKIPAPAPFETTFFTGHPKLMSMISGLDFSTISTACSIESKFAPKICIPTGLSFSYISSFITLFAASLISPSQEINSV